MTTKFTAPASRPGAVAGSGPSSWLVFASIMLGIAGVMRIFDAIWAFRYHGVVSQNLEDAIFGHSLTTYGWVYIVIAAILIASAVFVLQGSQIARWVGIAAAALGSISASWWLPYYPVWALLVIGFDLFVIWAVTVHGSDFRVA